MSGHSHDEHVTPAQDRVIARQALDVGDLEHGVFHVARAVAEEPLDPDTLTLLERLASLGKKPDEILPLDGNASYGEAATRAWLEYRAGLIDDGINLLCRVIRVRPDLPFWSWLKQWTHDDAVVASLAPDRLPGSLSHAIEGAREAHADVSRKACSELADITAAIRRQHPTVAMLAGLHCRALRGAARTADAIAVCEAEDARAPTYMSAVFLGGSRRDHGDHAGALAAYRTAWARDQSDAHILLDVGDACGEVQDYKGAIKAYEEALARGAGEHWAHSSIAYCRWLEDGKWEHRATLEARADAGEQRAQQLVRLVTPYVQWLPQPVDSVISIARKIASGEVTSGPVSLAISSVEAPSAVAELLSLCRKRFDTDVPISMSIPDPDPRRPRRSGAAWLWKFHQDHRPTPAVFAPSPDIAERVAGVAARRFVRSDWFDAACEMASGLDANAARDLHAVMIHPPPSPDDTASWDWRQRVQIAAAMGLAWLPGDTDQAIERLRWLVDGQVDWTCTAAMIVLAEIASRATTHADAIAQIFEEVYKAPRSPVVYMCLLQPVVELALQLPGQSTEYRTRWHARRAEVTA